MLPPVLHANWDPHLTQPHHHDTCTFPLQHHRLLSDHPMPRSHFSCGEVVQSYSWPSHVESGKTKSCFPLPSFQLGEAVWPLSCQWDRRSLLLGRLVMKKISFLQDRQESALNTDVMSGGTQLFCDKKVMPTRERAKKQPPSDWAAECVPAGSYLQTLIRREKPTPNYLSHCKPVFTLLLVIKVFLYW